MSIAAIGNGINQGSVFSGRRFALLFDHVKLRKRRPIARCFRAILFSCMIAKFVFVYLTITACQILGLMVTGVFG